MSIDTHVQFQDVVHHEMSIQELAEAMTEGQMVHMANHLYKHYAIGAQKLLKKIPTEDDERAYKMIEDACDYWKAEAERLEVECANWIKKGDYWKQEAEGLKEGRNSWYNKYMNASFTPKGKRLNVDGVDYILVRDGE